MTSNPLFEKVKVVFTDRDVEVDKADYWIVNKILSQQPSTTLMATEINSMLGRIPDWATSALFRYAIEKRQRAPYIYFHTKRKKVKQPRLTEKVCSTLHCSTKHAIESIRVLENMGIKVHEYYGLKGNE